MSPIGVVVPAHDEEQVLGRLLSALLGQAAPGELDVVVVANGCTDRTAEVARGVTGVRVVETPVPSKSRALRLGDEQVTGFPRLYVDADVVLATADARALRDALAQPGVLAAGPVRQLPMDGVRWPVRWYYDVWQRLPAVAGDLFGRGVVAVNEAGHARLRDWPEVMSDDLVMATRFDVAECRVAGDARVTIYPPRTYGDLLRRRVRAMTGNRRLDRAPGDAPARTASGDAGPARPAPRTGLAEVIRLAAADPRLALKAALFALTAVVAKVRARAVARAGGQEWLRDESSRR